MLDLLKQDLTVWQEVQTLAQERSQTIAEIILAAVREYLQKYRVKVAPQREAPKFIGMIDGGEEDAAGRVEEILAREWIRL